MQLGGYELQIFVTFLVILGCALVALLVDYLKGSNEQLRERHVDLLVRQEQYSGRTSEDANLLVHSLTELMSEQTAVLKEIAERPIKEQEAARKNGYLEPKPAISHLKDIPVTEIPAPRREAPKEAVPEGEQVKISLIPEAKVVPAEAPPAPPVEHSAATPIPPSAETPAEPVHDFDRFLDQLVSEFEANPAAYPAPSVEASEVAGPVKAPPAEESVEESTAAAAPAIPLAPLAAALAETSSDFPTGLQSAAAFAEFLARQVPLHGLVLSIGINEFPDLHKNLGKAAAEQLLSSVDSLMQGLLRPATLLCRTKDDEFVLVEPDLQGPYAQRRLNEVSERLWDFQLRNLGNFSVVFSWGAQEAQGETLGEALEAARERMLETQASRKNSAFEKSRRRLATA